MGRRGGTGKERWREKDEGGRRGRRGGRGKEGRGGRGEEEGEGRRGGEEGEGKRGGEEGGGRWGKAETERSQCFFAKKLNSRGDLTYSIVSFPITLVTRYIHVFSHKVHMILQSMPT